MMMTRPMSASTLASAVTAGAAPLSDCCWKCTCASESDRMPHTLEVLKRMYPGGVALVSGAVVVQTVQFESFAPTQALDAFTTAGKPITSSAACVGAPAASLKISTLKLCRAHTTGKCRLGDKCRNIHLCASVSLSPVSRRNTTRLPPLSGAAPAVETSETEAAAPVASCTSPVVSARATRRVSSAAKKPQFVSSIATPAENPLLVNTSMDLEEIMLGVSTTTNVTPRPPSSGPQQSASSPVPAPPKSARGASCSRSPAAPSTTTTSGSTNSCFRRFVRKWNEPLVHGSGSVTLSSASSSLDVETIKAMVPSPAPPVTSSAERKQSFRRTSAINQQSGFFAVFASGSAVEQES